MKSRSRKSLRAGVGLAVLFPAAAAAVDLSERMARRGGVDEWTGPYLGTQVGFGRSTARRPRAGSVLSDAGHVSDSVIGGVQLGYNYQPNPAVLLGVEADLAAPNARLGSEMLSSMEMAGARVDEHWDAAASLRGRLGATLGPFLFFATAGLGVARERLLGLEAGGGETKQLNTRWGFVGGAGVEYSYAPQWTLRLEYLQRHFGAGSVAGRAGMREGPADLGSVSLGLNRRIKDWSGTGARDAQPHQANQRWDVQGQTTFLPQAYPGFRAPYSGANSLSPNRQMQESWSSSLFLNARLWEGGEVYFNPEMLQGFGLSNTSGIAGFPNGEAQKSGFAAPRYNNSRLFLRQTFGLGGEQEELAAAPLQLAGKQDISRLTFQIGKLAVVDTFDGNAYAHDPRRDFMNWSIWASGAFDYPADKLGLGYGGTIELNQKQWALRGGYFLMDAESDANDFDMHLGRRGQYVVELETRHQIFGQPGRLRSIGFVNSAWSGSYRQALDNPAPEPDIAASRRGRIKYGYAFNLEQAISDDVGLFGRWSWNDGRSEIMAFTDIDRSLSGGLSIKGTRWGRSEDVVGIAGAVNGVSRDHRDFLAAGGMGILVGDGALNYRRESVFEAYYAFAVNKSVTVTADYQLITNPGFNADRGPVSVYSARLHAEF